MLLRPRQKLFVERNLRALGEHSNTLGVGPTGSGKAIMPVSVIGATVRDTQAKASVFAHRDEFCQTSVLITFRFNRPAICAPELGDAAARLAAWTDVIHHFGFDCPVLAPASAWTPLCRLPATSMWVWLVRSGAIERAASIGALLLDALPGFLGVLGTRVLRRG
jgi:hypothetical protein